MYMKEATWGMRFNDYPDHQRVRKGQRPEGCPDWFESHHIRTWQEQGLVLWNNIDKRIESLRAADAIALLTDLKSQQAWKSRGVSVTRLVHQIPLNTPTRGKRKKNEPQPEVEQLKGEDVYQEIIHLPPEAGQQLIELLESKKEALTRTAEEQKKRFEEALRQVWDHLIEWQHKQELQDFDFGSRSFQWESDSASRMVCHFQTAEGRIWLAKDKLFWNTCVKREGHAGHSHIFVKIAEAVDWVEQKIVELANEPEEKQERPFLSHEEIKANHLRLKQKLINGPFWIDPSRMEPQQITYQILIDLEVKPISYKSFETICGDTYKYPDQYPTPIKFAHAISIDFGHFQFEQPFGENSDLFRLTSLTNYYQEASAAEQAQQVWNQSRILQQFKAGEIVRGRFGYQEAEMGYIVVLGACGQTDRVWKEHESRNDYMDWKALRESLSYALDLADYRDFLGVSAELIDDDQLIEFMHQNRAESKFLPEVVRRESKVWLAQHQPLE
jgi:hypothetical protein